MRLKCVLALGCAVLFTCSSPTEPTKTIKITFINWYYENNPSDRNAGHLDLNTDIHYSGSSIQSSDLSSISITTQSVNWQLSPAANGYNLIDTANTIQTSIYSSLSSNGTVMPIDSFSFKVALSNGSVTSQTIVLSAPGSSTTQGYKYENTESYTGTKPSTFVQTIRRPLVDSCYFTHDSLIVKFRIGDTLFYNGFVWFYNSSGVSIGGSPFFRDIATKALSTAVNGGIALYSDSLHQNTVVLSQQFSIFFPPYSLHDIYSVRVVATDGRQYQSVPNYSYRNRAISLMSNLP